MTRLPGALLRSNDQEKDEDALASVGGEEFGDTVRVFQVKSLLTVFHDHRTLIAQISYRVETPRD